MSTSTNSGISNVTGHDTVPPMLSPPFSKTSNQNQNIPSTPQDQLSFSQTQDLPAFAAFQDNEDEVHGGSTMQTFSRSPKQNIENIPSSLNMKPSIKNSYSRLSVGDIPVEDFSFIDGVRTNAGTKKQSLRGSADAASNSHTNESIDQLTSDFFQPSLKPTLPATPEREIVEASLPSFRQNKRHGDDDFDAIKFSTTKNEIPTKNGDVKSDRPLSPVFSSTPVFRTIHSSKSSGRSSFEAFEASFATAFPTDFSKQDDNSLSSTFENSEFADPFFYGGDNTFPKNNYSAFETRSANAADIKANTKISNTRTLKETGDFHSSFRRAGSNGSYEYSESASTSPLVKQGIADASDSKQTFLNSTEHKDAFAAFNSSSMDFFDQSAMGTFEIMSEVESGTRNAPNGRKMSGSDGRSSPVRSSKTNSTSTRTTEIIKSMNTGVSLSPVQSSLYQNQENKTRHDRQGHESFNASNTPHQHQPESEQNQSPTVVVRRLHQRRAQEKIMKTSASNVSSSKQDPSHEEYTDPDDVPLEPWRSVKTSNSLDANTNSSSPMESHLPMKSSTMHSGPLSEKENTNFVHDTNDISNDTNKITELKTHMNLTAQKKNTFERKQTKEGNEDKSKTQRTPLTNGDGESQIVFPGSDNLEGIANTISSRKSVSSMSSTRRRAVRQPVSYAEPSLNSKLRRGDVFFPKTEKPGKDSDDINATTISNQSSEIKTDTNLNHVAI
eukprot:CAMPEP_0172505782 /NCGR_PEP_ID=MMETSP1066-20121228/188903_1 /TAXON_ID=671091 /ORGANISM="Coscinodiscus wailesii, Strain CCMP2513" /LENGTH=723 /DNA_ID=CAMNT_0013282519 /DNA_START=214 /DNA_END=2385 /DNA_ORIENTATION=-